MSRLFSQFFGAFFQIVRPTQYFDRNLLNFSHRFLTPLWIQVFRTDFQSASQYLCISFLFRLFFQILPEKGSWTRSVTFHFLPTVVLWAVWLWPVLFNFSSKNCLTFPFCFAPFKQSALFCSNPENHLLQVNNETFVCPAVHQIQEAMWNVHHESWNAKNWKFPQIFADYLKGVESLLPRNKL